MDDEELEDDITLVFLEREASEYACWAALAVPPELELWTG